MKKISFMIPCYNEEENVVPMAEAIIDQMVRFLPNYDYDILFIDNCSTDNTRPLLTELCAGNPKIKAIFNARNFGQFSSPFHGICQTVIVKTWIRYTSKYISIIRVSDYHTAAAWFQRKHSRCNFKICNLGNKEIRR